MTSFIEKIINMKPMLIKKIGDINEFNSKREMPQNMYSYFNDLLYNYIDTLEKINYILIFGLKPLQEIELENKNNKCTIRNSYEVFSKSCKGDCSRIANHHQIHSSRLRFFNESKNEHGYGFNKLKPYIDRAYNDVSQKVFSVEKLKQNKIDEKFNFICENWDFFKNLITRVKIIDLSVAKKIRDNKDDINICLEHHDKKILTKIQNIDFEIDKKILSLVKEREKYVKEREKYISRYEFMKSLLISVIFNLCICMLFFNLCICMIFKK